MVYWLKTLFFFGEWGFNRMEGGSWFPSSRCGVWRNDKKVSVSVLALKVNGDSEREGGSVWEINLDFRKPFTQPGSNYQSEPWTLRVLLVFSPFFSTENILLWYLVIQIVPGIISELDWTCFLCIISLAYTSQADVLADLITGKKGDRLVLKKQNRDQKSEKNIIFCYCRNRTWRNRRPLRAFTDKVWKWTLFSNLLLLLLLKHRFFSLS